MSRFESVCMMCVEGEVWRSLRDGGSFVAAPEWSSSSNSLLQSRPSGRQRITTASRLSNAVLKIRKLT